MFRGWILVPLLALAMSAQNASRPAPSKFRISGTVTDSLTGNPLSDIEVSIALSQAQDFLQTVTTDADGRFEFDGLARDKYGLTAHGRGYHQQGFEEHEGYFTGIVTGPGMNSENLQFRLKPDSSISGTITDEFNDPAPSVHVLLFRTDMLDASRMSLMQSEVTTDDTGHYRFGRLQDGKYYVVAYGEPWYARDSGQKVIRRSYRKGTTENMDEDTAGPQNSDANQKSEFDLAFRTTYYPSATEPEQAAPIVLKPGERATADFQLFAVPSVQLRIRGGAEFAKQSGSVSLVEPIFNYSRQVSGQAVPETGTELTGLAPGHYILRFPARDAAGAEEQEPLDLFGDMEAGPGDRGKLISTLSGTLRTDTGDPPSPNVIVQLTNAATGERLAAQIIGAKFELQGGVRAGRYNVTLLNSDDYEPRLIAATGARVNGTQLEVPAGSAVRLSITATKGLGTIDGIALQGGKPVSQTAVVLLPNDPTHNLTLLRRDQSDSDGTFTLRRVLPGNYTVVAVADGWDLDWTDASVAKVYAAGGEKIYIQPQGGKYQVKVAVQSKRN